MVNIDTRTDPIARSPVEFDTVDLPRSFSSKMKYAIEFAKDVKQVEQWAQICTATEDAEMADIAPHERTRERKRKVLTHDYEGEKDYEAEDEEDKEDQEYGKTKRRVRQKVTKSKSSSERDSARIFYTELTQPRSLQSTPQEPPLPEEVPFLRLSICQRKQG